MTTPERPKAPYTGALARLRASTSEPFRAGLNAEAHGGPVRAAAPAPGSTEPPFNPRSWSGALITMFAIDAGLWIIQIINASSDYGLNRYGLRPRELRGLEGVITSWFLNDSYWHLLTTSAPLVIVGWFILLSGIRPLVLSTAVIVIAGGLATWVVSPANLIVGSSSLVIGWMGYLFARAYFSRKITWIIGAVAVAVFFTGLLGGLLPGPTSDSTWQAHLCAFLAGLLGGGLLHPRRRKTPRPVRSGSTGSQP
ncbi:MAG: rhomboid family intramembrane serine protease [Actinobacteria bacterium]|nr:rhomboid family intramembrane serine protease [Actinomycetota bacterium]